MKTKNRIIITALSVLVSIASQSCVKENIQKNVKPSDVFKSNAIAELAFSDLNNQSKTGLFQAQVETVNGKGISLMNNPCATITITPYDWSTFPKTIEIDFGSGASETTEFFERAKSTFTQPDGTEAREQS